MWLFFYLNISVNKCILKSRLKVLMFIEVLIWSGRLFHIAGPQTLKALEANVFSCCIGYGV